MSRERRTHTLTVMVEPKEGAWHAWCPVLLDQGAATWAATREEALEHIRAVVRMIVERMAEAGVPIPASGTAVHPAGSVPALGEQVAVTVCLPAT
jgi:predicted RNase H-like HicB family nuclease